ncbi:DUF1003 domain-containing protein [Bacillus sp. 1NLA3E]|uniref:DUF1003 domain-containing protein n=1 Tax=Bacillus sp. 1NLA3E TaxID=666686 RepID=UPI000247ED07|nr:DUF1003 domain-containing protein [Bacillus sp. 1NLA3E]AGK53501.1 hypothetical protein B1NLA3E_08695 [Bacillus sp. 1NLA3E]
MSINEKRLELIKTILEDDSIAAEEDEILHILLQERISKNSMLEHDEGLTFGEKAADNLAKFAGSWAFIIIFFFILSGWITLNAVILTKPYDIYPFILLNLILSCLAAIQAPVIMMSQNRQEQKDRLRAKNDFKVNLKAEIIIEDIHQKLSTIIENQQNMAERLNIMENKQIK